MNRKIIIEFPDIKSKISATLLDKDEPEQCEKFWQVLETPSKMICHHTLSTGDLFEGYGRPLLYPVEVDSQVNPIGRKQWLLSNLEPGMLLYAGRNAIDVAYVPHITEPLTASGSVVAKVDPDCLNDLMKGKPVKLYGMLNT